MPQYVMPGSDNIKFKQLDEFTQGYVTAMMWTETDNLNGNNNYPNSLYLIEPSFDYISDSALQSIIDDCASFQKSNAALLIVAYANVDGYDENSAGTDYWLSRNGHGAGYFDRGLGAIGDELQKISRLNGEVDLYVDNDYKIYIA